VDSHELRDGREAIKKASRRKEHGYDSLYLPPVSARRRYATGMPHWKAEIW
jgi:hypothetical protein